MNDSITNQNDDNVCDRFEDIAYHAFNSSHLQSSFLSRSLRPFPGAAVFWPTENHEEVASFFLLSPMRATENIDKYIS